MPEPGRRSGVWHGGRVPAYEAFASFYDEVMDDPGPRADRVARWIGEFRPGAQTLLELGCGTGSLLARLPEVPVLTGLDSSPQMLAVAATKVPGARLVEVDMRTCSFGERFEVVCCVFDSLNHLLDFDEWTSVFETVHHHLADDGLFIFDVNTVGELARLGEEPPWVYDFDGGTAVIDVISAEALGEPVEGDVEVGQGGEVSSVWDIRVFEHVQGSRYSLHHEQIGELAVPLARVRAALAGRFELLDEMGDDGEHPTDSSVKGHFAYRRLR